MPQWLATVIGIGCVLIVNIVCGAYLYGKLTQQVATLVTGLSQLSEQVTKVSGMTEKVNTLDDRTVDHGRRIGNVETVLSGPGGHGERLTSLEAWRIEHRAKSTT